MTLNSGALSLIHLQPVSGRFYRYIRTRFAKDPLSMVGALQNGGRYNVVYSFGALYLGIDRTTCEAEVSNGIAAGLRFKTGAFTAWDYDVNLNGVVRLDQAEIQAAIGVTQAQITIPGDHWTASAIGEPLYNRGDVEAIMAPSAHLATGTCLDVFLDRVRSPSKVKPGSALSTWP